MYRDPEGIRWKQRYPKFPGVAKCVELLGRRNVKGGYLEIVCYELQNNAAAHAAELIAAFRAEGDERVRRILLGVIYEARLPEALPVFVEHLRSHDESLRYWSELGLRSLDTAEARKALWEASLNKPRIRAVFWRRVLFIRSGGPRRSNSAVEQSYGTTEP